MQNIFMLSIKKNFGRLLVILCAALCFIVALSGSAAVQPQELYLGGFPAGFVLETTTVEVVGMCDVMTDSGLKSPARDGGLKTGDIIKKINNKEITSSEQVTEMLSAQGLKRADLCVERDGEEVLLSLVPVKDITTGKMRVGVLVRDSLSGVGTVTYIDKTNNKFGSLGHPVTDTAGKITKINGGTLYGCIIYDVKRGVRGSGARHEHFRGAESAFARKLRRFETDRRDGRTGMGLFFRKRGKHRGRSRRKDHRMA